MYADYQINFVNLFYNVILETHFCLLRKTVQYYLKTG